MRDPAPWVCPICREPLVRLREAGPLACLNGHSFDVARQGYVNLLVAGQRRSRQPGDSKEMIDARARFLATGAYDRLGDVIASVVARTPAVVEGRATLLDVGCGDGHHTRRVASTVDAALTVIGVDVSKPAIATAASAHRDGHYAVASAADLPLETATVDTALIVFGPAMPHELARVVRPGGLVVAAHPGPDHLTSLRALVYDEPRPHEVKDPLRSASEVFARVGSVQATFPVAVTADLFTMTPYRWHAPPNIADRLAAADGTTTTADVIVTSYRRAAP